MILALIASNVAWALFFVKQQGELNAKINILTAQNLKLAKDNKSLQDESDKSSADDSTDYREIPELGVKYKLDGTTKNVTYSYANYGDKFISVSTTNVYDSLKDDTELQQSENGNYNVANIYQYSEDKIPAKFGTLAELQKNKIAKKIGNYYYILDISPTASEANNLGKALKASVPAVQAAYDTLKAN